MVPRHPNELRPGDKRKSEEEETRERLTRGMHIVYSYNSIAHHFTSIEHDIALAAVL